MSEYVFLLTGLSNWYNMRTTKRFTIWTSRALTIPGREGPLYITPKRPSGMRLRYRNPATLALRSGDVSAVRVVISIPLFFQVTYFLSIYFLASGASAN